MMEIQDNWFLFCKFVKIWTHDEFQIPDGSQYIDERIMAWATHRQDQVDALWPPKDDGLPFGVQHRMEYLPHIVYPDEEEKN